ncbi:MAG: aminotransferase class V-fold PLP-dependent enzyme, partial [Terriglobales bacterium]
SCSQGALSDAVEAALQAHIRSWHEHGSPWDRWVEEYERARTAFARFIGAAPEEVAVITSASAGINSIASALNFGKRRKVVMGEFEFPTMGQIWLAQERRGAEIKFLSAQNGKICPDCYARAIDDQTLIVPLTHVCFMNGFRSEVAPIVKQAHERGALVMLDDYQDCGTRPIDVKALDVDFYVSGALKYLLCPSESSKRQSSRAIRIRNARAVCRPNRVGIWWRSCAYVVPGEGLGLPCPPPVANPFPVLQTGCRLTILSPLKKAGCAKDAKRTQQFLKHP